MSSSSSASSASATISSIASSLSSAKISTTTISIESVSSVASSIIPENTKPSEKEVREKAQEIVANDLKTWQEKFAKAADEGSDELDARILEITEKMIKSQADGVGKALNIELEETATSSFKGLKSKIVSIVKHANEGDNSEEELNQAVRKAGAAIKDKAQAVRTWRKNYDEETNSLISKAAEDTFDIIDHIRDLGLQEIGMRWAWTDGITHKDWSKYHQLKTKFDEWRVDVEKVAIEHPGLLKARAASEDVEEKALHTASDAAKELARLKETGLWKLSTGDSSDDFNTKYIPAAAAKVGQKIVGKASQASEAVAGSTQGTVESIISQASSIASSQTENIKSAGSDASRSAESLASSLSSTVVGTSQGTVESIASVASSSASSLSAKASSSIVGVEPGVVEKASNGAQSVASVVASSASEISKVASSSISSGSSVIASVSSSVASSLSEAASSSSSSVSSDASSASATASKKVWGGAMAQSVKERKIILDDVIDDSDDDTFSEQLASLASQAGDRYSDITKAVSEALLKPTSTDKYPITKIAATQYSSALAAASVALYGTAQGTAESVSSLVASRYSDAVAA